MARTCLLLVAACVAALAPQGSLALQKCTTVSQGDTSWSLPHKMAPVTLLPGVRKWHIFLNGTVQCPAVRAVGAVATVCEYDRAPEVSFISRSVLYVYRTGTTRFPAEVLVTLYCLPFPGTAPQSVHADGVNGVVPVPL